MDKKHYVLGAGGHACVLIDILKHNNQDITAIFSPDIDRTKKILSNIPFFKSEDDIFQEDPDTVLLINGIGSMPNSRLRKIVYQKFTNKGFKFQRVISQQAIISSFATLGEGVQVMPGAIIQVGAMIGDHSIINTGVIIEHDCVIGRHNHIAPGATLSGQVITGDYVHIGTGANVIQSVSIGSDVIVGAGATVLQNVASSQVIYGFKSSENKRIS